MTKLLVNDLFCGCGGIGLGFKQSELFDIAGAWDFNEHAVASYKHNVGDHVVKADIRNMTSEDLPFANVIAYGFPCQDLSKNGSGAGLIEGRKSRMFFEVMRLLKELETAGREKPQIMLVENVPGLSKYFDVLSEEFAKVGYKMYHKKFVSKYWGVPQARERMYVVGVRDDIKKDFIFPEQQTAYVPKLKDVLEDDVDASYFVTPDQFDDGFLQFKGDHYTVRQATKKGYDEAYIGDSINISHPKSKTRRGRVGKQIAQTLLTSREQLVVLDDFRLRYMTPREFARLQGFSDQYEIIVSPNQAYFQFGNAVTVNIVEAIAKKIKEFLDGE